MRIDRIRNGAIKNLVKVTPFEDKMRETRFQWFGHVKRRSMDAPVRRCKMINIPEGKRRRGRPKKSLDEVIREDLKIVSLTEDLAQDRKLWRAKIKILDRREPTQRVSFCCSDIVLVRVFFICRICMQVVLSSGKRHRLFTSGC